MFWQMPFSSMESFKCLLSQISGTTQNKSKFKTDQTGERYSATQTRANFFRTSSFADTAVSITDADTDTISQYLIFADTVV